MKVFKRRVMQLLKVNVPKPEAYFLTKHYQLHNIARLKHLDSLGLDLYGKKVIEFGAGIGDHTYFYLLKNCDVMSTDARPELVKFIENKFGNRTMVLNVETDIGKILSLPKFDIIHCYGLLYHINNPEEFLRSLKDRGSLIILETCVSADNKPTGNYIIAEDKNDPTQAFSGSGSRPTRDWIFRLLNEIFPYVYVPITQPDHPEFPKDWTKDLEDRYNLIRAVFIASEKELTLTTLLSSLPKKYN
jgi:SAM-dependent methyltransferase